MTKLDDSFSPNVMKDILTIFKKIKIKINVNDRYLVHPKCTSVRMTNNSAKIFELTNL